MTGDAAWDLCRRMAEETHLDLVGQGLLAMAGDDAHPVVVAELCFYRATLEIVHDNYEQAGRLTEQGTEILHQVVDLVLGSAPDDDDVPTRTDSKPTGK